MDSLIGQTLGQYEIRAKIGSGGMATVYRARQLSVDRDVAIKIIRPDLVEEQGFIERFQREARTIAALSHLHILKVFDYGHERGLSYLVMELLEGGSLSKKLRSGGPYAMPDASRTLDQIAAALDYAHQRGVIHRDLKPDNVLLDKDGNAFLTDFGIAKLLNESTSFTRTGMVMGTPSYMAPELWSGQPADTRTDNYALGVILFEMLTGTSPFIGDTPYRIMHMHIYEPPPAASALNKALPPVVDTVLHKALAKDPESRYVSAGQLAAAFRAVATGAPLPAATPSGQWSGVLTAAEPAPRPPSPPRGTLAGASAGPAPQTPSSGGRPPTQPHQPLATVEAESPRRSGRLPALLLGGVVLVALVVIGALALSASQGSGGAAGTGTSAALAASSTPDNSVIVAPATVTATLTQTLTATQTLTPSETATNAPSLAPSATETATSLPTLTSTPSATASATATVTATASPTATATPTVTPTMTPSFAPSATQTASTTPTATVGVETLVAATLSARDTATAFAEGVFATVNAVNTQNAAPKATLALQMTRTAIQSTIDAVQTVARATVNAQLTAAAATLFTKPTYTNTPTIPTSVFGATVTPYSYASPTPASCPGFLPSRLTVGQPARITPGDPNRLRLTPGTGSAHPVVTQVPGGGVIQVLEGPVCTTESGGGVAWWRVEWYDASSARTYTGWTAEGMGTIYWVEPWTP